MLAGGHQTDRVAQRGEGHGWIDQMCVDCECGAFSRLRSMFTYTRTDLYFSASCTYGVHILIMLSPRSHLPPHQHHIVRDSGLFFKKLRQSRFSYVIAPATAYKASIIGRIWPTTGCLNSRHDTRHDPSRRNESTTATRSKSISKTN